MLDRAAPFHLVLGAELTILQFGRSLAQLCPSLSVGVPFDEVVAIHRPTGLRGPDVLGLDGRLCHLEVKGEGLPLRGQWLMDADRMVFLGRPSVASFDDLSRHGLRLSHFAVHDPVADYLFSLQARDHSLADIRVLQHRLEARNVELERAEKDRVRLQAAAADALQQSLQKTSFLTNMSHELRTPLNAIIGYAELLADEDAGLNEDVERILQAARHLKRLVDEVLDLAEVESGRARVERSRVLMKPFVDRVLESHRPAASRKGLELTATVKVDEMFTDPQKLFHIVSHLLSNAVRATQSGSIWVNVEGVDQQVFIDVVDTGRGMPPEAIDRLFRPFVQGSDSERVGGAGLGLTISRLLARLLGGELTVESAVGVGSTFRLAFPVEAEGPPCSECGTAAGGSRRSDVDPDVAARLCHRRG